MRLRLRLRQMSERNARASPDDTAGAGHFTLQRTAQRKSRLQGGIDNLKVARSSLLKGTSTFPTLCPGQSDVASSRADVRIQDTKRSPAVSSQVCITQYQRSIIDTQVSLFLCYGKFGRPGGLGCSPRKKMQASVRRQRQTLQQFMQCTSSCTNGWPGIHDQVRG
jgi:hypothetical protein